MIKIIIISLLLGILFILGSFISKVNIKSMYTKSHKNKLLSKLKEMSFLNAFITDSSSNDKLFKKISLINQCKKNELIYAQGVTDKNKISKLNVDRKEALRKVYSARLLMIVIFLIGSIFVKISFNTSLKNEELSVKKIYNQLNYSVEMDTLSQIIDYVGDDYVDYFKKSQKDEFDKLVYSYCSNNRLDITKADINKIVNIYSDVYQETSFNFYNVAPIIIISLLSNFLVIFYINMVYRIYKIRLSKEFNQVELIAILHMNREDLNIYEILKEVNKYCVYLKPYMTKCLNKYNSDPIVALNELADKVDDADFSNFIKVIKSCLNTPKDINTNILALQRKLRYISKKIDNADYVEKKILWLTMASFPLIMLFNVNLILPFIENMDFSMGF